MSHSCGVLGLGLFFLGMALTATAETPEEIEARLEALREEISGIQQRIDRNLGERDRRLEALANAERRVSTAQREVRETASALEQTRDNISSLEAQIDELEKDAAEHGHALARQLAVAYRHGGDSRLKMLLNQDDPRRLSRQMAYYGYLARARLDAIEQLNRTMASLQVSRLALADEESRQADLLAGREAELTELEVARAEREQALARLEERIRDDRERVADLEANAEELRRLLDELATALADVPPDFEVAPFPELRGELPTPVDGPVVRSFGDRRGGDMQWSGWLIQADHGEPIQAIAHGRVAYADWLRGYGLMLIIDHGDGFMSLYAHSESLLRDVGDWVNPGETIATVGNSGGNDQPGVYFELRRDGQPVDPVNWVAR
ncbi:murein hydrolase activator EnvC family protein [Wenzhouxiangella sp. AB-CW3]|uniref:murein hydrolase activator EnvC family protein n=1 Tax=Wenzhouxiangella sp. AB-CW3 TaxID=2771012 RepID=UPI001CC32282|nr:peptidoglycan DD-metalloendopeptidase family protein [Wenzhouxiangella sp. AB-CW3]